MITWIVTHQDSFLALVGILVAIALINGVLRNWQTPEKWGRQQEACLPAPRNRPEVRTPVLPPLKQANEGSALRRTRPAIAVPVAP